MLLALWLVIAPTLAAVLGIAALAKVRDPRSVDRSFSDLDVPAALSKRWMRRAFPWAELALAAALLLSWGWAAIAAAALALLLCIAYVGLVARALAAPELVPCGCFGESDARPVDRATLARNLVLVAAAAVGLLAVALDADAGDAVWPVLAVEHLPVVIAAATVAVVVIALARNGDLPTSAGAAVDATAGATASAAAGPAHPGEAAQRGDAAHPADPSPPSPGEAPGDDGLLDYVREPIPPAAVQLADGSIVGLRQLASRKPILLIHASTSCTPCLTVLDDLDRIRRLAAPIEVLVVTPVGDVSDEHATALGDGLGAAFNLISVPWAAILGMDGLLAGGPVRGPIAIVEMVEDLRAELDEAGLTAD